MRKTLVVLVLTLLVSGCDYSATPVFPQDPKVPAAISLSASSAIPLASTGDTLTISAVVLNSAGRVIAAPDVEWSSAAPGVATISRNATGSVTVTAVDDGTAMIVARSGSIEGSTAVVVHRKLATVSLTAPSRVLAYGTTTQLVAAAFDARHTLIPNVQGFLYTSDNPGAAFVQPGGAVTALFSLPQLPDAVITASLTRDGVTATAKVTVTVGLGPDVDFGALMETESIVPLNPPTAGSGLSLFTRKADRINFTVLWSKLRNAVTSVEIHGPANTMENAGLLVNLLPLPTIDSLGIITGTITSDNIRSQNGRAPISVDSLAKLMCDRLAYVDIHTTRFQGGEIRGQIQCIR